MPLQGRCKVLLILVIYMTLLVLQQQKQSPIRSQLYAANPVFSVTDLFARPGDFRALLHFEPNVFIREIISYMVEFEALLLPRNYLIRADYQALGFVLNCRKCQIDFILRVIRYVLWTRRVPVSLLSFIFDQCLSVTYADIHHIAILFVDKLEAKHINPIIPNTPRYYDKIGSGPFRHFPRALRAIDIVKVHMTRPYNVNHADYFDGRLHQYCFGYMLSIDKDGECETYNGHLGGRHNDINNYYSSDLYINPGLYFGPGDIGLVDGIFTGVHPTLVGPINRMVRPLTPQEHRFNDLQSWDRAIVENYIGRLKSGCPVLRYYTFGVDSINYVFISCIILTNIRIKCQNRLRQ